MPKLFAEKIVQKDQGELQVPEGSFRLRFSQFVPLLDPHFSVILKKLDEDQVEINALEAKEGLFTGMETLPDGGIVGQVMLDDRITADLEITAKEDYEIIEIKEAVINPDYYEGPLEPIAEKVYEVSGLIEAWDSGLLSDSKRYVYEEGLANRRDTLLATIPNNLSHEQIKELSSIYLEKYNKDFRKALIQALFPRNDMDMFMRREEAIGEIMGRVYVPAQFEDVRIQTSVSNQLTTQGASIQLIYQGPSPDMTETMTGTGHIFSHYSTDPRVYTPRLIGWSVHHLSPDGSKREHVDFIKANHQYTSFENEHSFEAEELGYYIVRALILRSDTYNILQEHFEVIKPEDMAARTLEKMGEPKEEAYLLYHTGLSIKKGLLDPQVRGKNVNINSHILPMGQRNPEFFYSLHSTVAGVMRWDNSVQSYRIADPDMSDENRFIWYAELVDQGKVSDSNAWNFVNEGRTKQSVLQHQGREVFANNKYGNLDQPQPDKQVSINFPLRHAENIDEAAFNIFCEVYDKDGQFQYIEQYTQFFIDDESKAYQEQEKQFDTVKEQLHLLETHREKIEGEIHPLKAVYVNEETGNSLQLQLFYGTDKEDPKEMRLVDLTQDASQTEFTGDNIYEALSSFDLWERYPDGLIFIILPNGKQFKIETNGGSLVSQFGTWSGWLATLAFVGAVAATLIPGAQGAAPYLYYTAFTLGAITAGANIYDNLMRDETNTTMLAIDILVLAASFLGGGGNIMKGIGIKGLKALEGAGVQALQQTGKVKMALDISKYLFYSAAFTDGVAGVLITAEAHAQIQDIINIDSSIMSESQKKQKIALILSRLVVTLGLLIVTNKDLQAVQNTIKAIKTRASNVGIDFDNLQIAPGSKGSVQVDKSNVYTKPAELKKEVEFGEKIARQKRENLILAKENQAGVDGMYEQSGKFFQLKSLESQSKIGLRINEAYKKASDNGFNNVDLWLETTANITYVQKRWQTFSKQPNTLLKNDGTISEIWVHCSDGPVRLDFSNF